jgi:hypothetical protein
MQVLIDVKELRRIRVRWFKVGIFFTLSLIGVISILILHLTTPQGVNADSTFIATNDFKTIKPEIYTYPTPATIIKEPSNSTQTSQTTVSRGEWGAIYLVAFFTFFTISMIVVMFVHLRSKAKQWEIASKPEGFWNWNEGV